MSPYLVSRYTARYQGKGVTNHSKIPAKGEEIGHIVSIGSFSKTHISEFVGAGPKGRGGDENSSHYYVFSSKEVLDEARMRREEIRKMLDWI